ncbi:MAG TPA: hypothetical protein VK843_01635 [Planctomycetota bacterium]|nr:hypothetical protein [Planctomycetota bacterium]
MMLLSFLLAAQLDVVADLTRRSAELHSFTANYALTSTASPGTSEIRIEFAAPARVRVDRTAGKEHSSTWCVDGVLAMKSSDGERSSQGRADSAQMFAELEPLEKKLRQAFPRAVSRPALAAAVGMRWEFDAKAQRANFSIEPSLVDQGETPLGWLKTLTQKGAAPREDQGLLHFETDSAFQIAISPKTGFVEHFSGKSPKGEMNLVLISLELDKPIDPARFALPAPAPGAKDVTSDLLRAVSRFAEVELRGRIYDAMAGKETPSDWDEAFQAKAATVLQPFYERALPKILESKAGLWSTTRDEIAQRIAGMRASGKSEEEVETVRQRETGYLKKQMDELEQGFLTRLQIPATAEQLPRAAELLTLEKRSLSAAFHIKVSEPMVSAFEAATKKQGQ